MFVRHAPAVPCRRWQLHRARINNCHQRRRGNRRNDHLRRQLIQVSVNFNPAATLLCHVAALAVHLFAAIPLHHGHAWSRSTNEHRQHHENHDSNSHDTHKSAHSLTIFLHRQPLARRLDDQFSVGLLMWSTTRFGTGSCSASSFSPICSCTAVKIEGQLSGSFADHSRPN